MSAPDRARRRLLTLAPAAAAGLLISGCSSGRSAATAGTAPTAAASTSTGSNMSGMDMGSTPSAGASAGGITAVPMQVLGTGTWQGMKITAQAMTPVPFLIYNGTSMQTVEPPKKVSFHLMVLLNDAQTNVVIPYASVWATIKQGSKTVYDENLWPMISRYMGPHYGADVSLPGTGTYELSLLISPPVSARHLEYENVWLKPHTATSTFDWKPA